ncbi:peptidylprolyl isomerase [Luteirhabdus pelagi]|uniref:peptidylprolyl isomerase n=1 Tax=Luteirhabdus pelagi TaxID=2792783 RepID=UPI0019394C82|nr:peptidylprolyl isomerase [Luteirhabdus pelagi]
MLKSKIAFLFVLAVSATAFGQIKKKDVLLSIDGEPVSVQEFKRVYKKNLDLVQDESQKTVEGYLELFIDYKLKTTEARAQGLDETQNYSREFRKYQEQLSRNYIYEDKVTSDLAREAYERGQEEINANHILVRTAFDDLPQDTLKAYKKITEVREKALAGEPFDELAKQYSEEPNASETAGHLGWFGVFTMVYPFETAAYETPVGGVSDIIRTEFGYHILKVNDRREKVSQIMVSHIMISDKNGDASFDPKERAEEIYTMLKQGESFENLAKQFSDDKNSAIKGGKLRPFGRGDLRSEEFENAAYGLNEPGEISKPVKSEFGWHIIRFEQEIPEPTFEEELAKLERQVRDGNRHKVVTQAVNQKIKDKYGFKLHNGYLDFFNEFVTDSVLRRKWKYNDQEPKLETKLFTIGDKTLKYRDLAEYMSVRQKRMRGVNKKTAALTSMYDEFETMELKNYFRNRLEEENEEYAAVISEYRDGLLIFDLMEENIWNKAKKDSVGLEDFYERNKDNYRHGKQLVATIATATDKQSASRIAKMLQSGNTVGQIKETINSNGTINAVFSEGVFEKGDRELPSATIFEEGVSEIYEQNGSFIVVNVKKILPAGFNPLDKVRGKVMSDYQMELEQKFMEDLRSKHTVEINNKALKRVKKELDS